MDDLEKEKKEKFISYIFITIFVCILAYLFFAAYEGLWPYEIIGYVPLYIHLAEPWGLYLLFWLAIISLIIGLIIQKRSKELILSIILISGSIFIIMLVIGTIPGP